MANSTLENVKLHLGLEDDTQDALLTLIIENVKTSLINLIGKTEYIDNFPKDLNYIVEEVAVRRYYRRGAEGMKRKTVDGYTVEYTNDFTDYEAVIERYKRDDGESGQTIGVATFY